MSEISLQRRIGYSDKVIEHFKNPRNIGRMDDPDATAKVGSVACGDLIKIYLKVDDASKIIDKISFESYGCAANIATTSMMTEMVKGKNLDEAKKMGFKDIAEELGGLPKIKMHCAVLSKTGLNAAIMKYEVKKGLAPINDTLVKMILRGVLDPVEGVDILSAKMVEAIQVEGNTIHIKLAIKEGTELAKTLEEDIREAFEGLDVNLQIELQH